MFLKQILETAIQAKASDIHMAVGLPPVSRIHGQLVYMGQLPLNSKETRAYAEEILDEKHFNAYLESGECDASFTYANKYYFRVNVFNQRNDCSIAMRLIPAEIPTLESLKLPDVIRALCLKRRGLILVTGPTGSGKTTTLAAMIEYMSRIRNEHILTVEDPIEYVFSHGSGIVNQRQLGSDTRTFDKAIYSALREDIDVMMVGEMRDLSTISAAITAAETGHLVLSTLHTTGAGNTVDRIIDVFPAEQQQQVRTQLSTNLVAVISQQLVPTRTGSRQLIQEIMIGDYAISNLIRDKKTNQLATQMQMKSAEGMITMDHALLRAYKNGSITEQTVLRYCVDLPAMKKRFNI